MIIRHVEWKKVNNCHRNEIGPATCPYPAAIGRCRRGNVAIEFAIIAPLLAIFLVGVIEIGLATAAFFTVQEAALAGANYASHNGWNSDAISGAVTQSAQRSDITAAPAPTTYCGCPSGPQIAEKTCGLTCPDGLVTRKYVKVSASMPRPSVVKSSFGLPPVVNVTLITRIP